MLCNIMFKPLLRTIPCLSGNFTLACKLDKYEKISPINFECGINNAVLMPLQNNLANKHINVSLLYDAYEYDIKEYFKSFSSIFYNENYEYDKNNIYDIDLTGNPTYKNRNMDYEFGCKRNIMNSGYQYMFYAPFYINNTVSLPDEFIIHIDFDNNRYKEIHVKIFDNTSKVTNYLSVYLKRYVEQIDERCIFCLPESNQGSYYGVDVQYGGFKNVRDNVIGAIYNKQLSLNDYDKIICNGFQRNKLIMKQIIPLSFMFNIEDILTSTEFRYNINNIIRISGWYQRNGMKYDFYDFDTDYKSLLINDVNVLSPTENDIYINKNLRASLYEAKDTVFKYDNTVSKTYNRWCLLSTINDDEIYITNSSNIFLDNNDNYYNIPIRYNSNSSYLYYDVDDINLNKSKNSLLNNNIDSIITQTHFSENSILNDDKWYDVFNNKCIIGGILYDLNPLSYTYNTEYSYAIQQEHTFNKYQKIDKFNIFAYVNPISVDNAYYCKYSLHSDEQMFNGITYENYAYSFFRHNIEDYAGYYEKYHEVNTLFNKISYVYNEDTNNYVFVDENNNVVTENIYIDYSYNYYLSNLYDLSTNSLGSSYTRIFGYEVLNDIEPASFIKALSQDKLSDDNKLLMNNIYVMNYSSDNAKPISIIGDDADINDKNSRIAIKRLMINEYDKYDKDERATKIPKYNSYDVLNSYFHYVPSYKSASFSSHGHFEQNDLHDDYVYCDMWNLENYFNEWNDEHVDKIFFVNSSYIIDNAYLGFINKEQYTYYANRMYGYDINNVDAYSYVLISYANCQYIKYGNVTNNPLTINSIYRQNKFVPRTEYTGQETTEQLIEEHRLYHKNRIYKLNGKTVKQILNIYNKYHANNDDSLSLILYTTNTNIIDSIKINYINKRPGAKNKGETLYIPLSKEILWSKQSQNETYKILSSRNIKFDEDDMPIRYDTYDLTNCNYAGNIDNCMEICKDYPELKNTFYELINIPQIESDNVLHIVNNNGINYAYYYIKLNLFDNAHSFNMSTNDMANTFDINKYSLNELLPYISDNILDYILLNLANDSILDRNIISVMMNKQYNSSLSTVVQNESTSNSQMSRYFNDITPVIRKTSSVIPYSIKYKNPLLKNVKDDVIKMGSKTVDNYVPTKEKINPNIASYSSNATKVITDSTEAFTERTIEYDSNIYKNKEFGLPCITYNNKIEFIEEYEYKFYNDNKLYLLETFFTIVDKKYYTIEELREHEKNEYVLNNVFKPRILKRMHEKPENDDVILFLFNRYKVEYESYPIQTDLTGEYKLYKLKYIFTLM